MSRAPSNNPPGLEKFESDLNNVIEFSKNQKSMAGLKAMIDSMEWVCANSIAITSERLRIVGANLPKFDKDITGAMKAVTAANQVKIAQPAFWAKSVQASYVAKINSLSEQVGKIVAGNILQISDANSLMVSAGTDIEKIINEKKNTRDISSDSAINEFRKAAISIYWTKYSIESSILTVNAIIDEVESRLLKIPDMLYQIYVEENNLNGERSVMAKSVNAVISAKLENEKNALIAAKNKSLFDNCMEYAKQSELGGYIAKVLNTLFSLNDMRDIPAKYEVVQSSGRAGFSTEITQFYNDLYYNYLNEYKLLTDRQINYLAALSGGQVSVEELSAARAGSWKKEIEARDETPVSSLGAANPFAKGAVVRSESKNRTRTPPTSTSQSSEFQVARETRLEAIAQSIEVSVAPSNQQELQARIDEQNRLIALEKANIEESKRLAELEAANLRYKEELAAVNIAKSEKEKQDAVKASEKAAAELYNAQLKLAEAEELARKRAEEAEYQQKKVLEASEARYSEQMAELNKKIAEIESQKNASNSQQSSEQIDALNAKIQELVAKIGNTPQMSDTNLTNVIQPAKQSAEWTGFQKSVVAVGAVGVVGVLAFLLSSRSK